MRNKKERVEFSFELLKKYRFVCVTPKSMLTVLYVKQK